VVVPNDETSKKWGEPSVLKTTAEVDHFFQAVEVHEHAFCGAVSTLSAHQQYSQYLKCHSPQNDS